MPGVSVQYHQQYVLQKDHPALCIAFYMFVFELSCLLFFSLFFEEMREKAYPAESEPSEHSGIVHAILKFGHFKCVYIRITLTTFSSSNNVLSRVKFRKQGLVQGGKKGYSLLLGYHTKFSFGFE